MRGLGQDGSWGLGQAAQALQKGPRMSEHRAVLRPSPPKDLGTEVSRPVPRGAAHGGSRGQKEDKEGPLSPAPVMGPRSPSATAEIKGGCRDSWADTPA